MRVVISSASFQKAQPSRAEARPVPKSRDPRFYRYWVSDAAPTIDVEGICKQWEGTNDPEGEEPGG